MQRSDQNGWKMTSGSYVMNMSAEERYRLIAEFTLDWVYLQLPDGTFEYVSPSCKEITGYSPDEFIQDPSLYLQIVHPDDRPLMEGHVCKPGVRDSSPMEFRIIHRDGEERWISHLCHEVRNRKGDFIGCKASNRDITARKKYERSLKKSREQLMRLKEQLEAKNKELETVIGVVSHDLRTPLVSIHGFSGEIKLNCREGLDTLSGLNLPPEQAAVIRRIFETEIPECLGYIDVSAKAMDRLVRSLVKVARSGLAKTSPEPLDMNELVGSVAAGLQFKTKTAGTLLAVESLPPCFADKDHVTQIFSNLMDNAVKNIPPERQGQIRVTGTAEDGRSVYCVEDNGVGIAREFQQKIFDMFARLRYEQTEGEGIGLAVVKRMLDRNNGTIRVESEEGKGSRFYVTLPASDTTGQE